METGKVTSPLVTPNNGNIFGNHEIQKTIAAKEFEPPSAKINYSKTADDYSLTSFYKKIVSASHNKDEEYQLFMKYNRPSGKECSMYFPSKPADYKKYKGYYITGPEILQFYETEKKAVKKNS